MLLLANNPHGSEHLKDLLVGQILWVSVRQLIPVAVLSAVLLVVMWLRRDNLAGLLFYGLFALAITASVQLVGVYLVFASLIVPALATAGMSGPRRLDRRLCDRRLRLRCRTGAARPCSICPAAQ